MTDINKLFSKVIFFSIIVILFIFSYTCADTPLNIQMTNVRGTSFTISWITQSIEYGKIRYGSQIENDADWLTVNDHRGEDTIDDIHYVVIDNIRPQQIYYYEIVSGNTIDNNNNQFYKINSGPALTPPGGSCQPAGKVFKYENSSIMAFDSIVYVTILGESATQNSAVESVIVTSNENGYWFLDLINFRTQDYKMYFPFECGVSNIRIKAQGGNDGESQMEITAMNYGTGESPPIYLSEKNSTPFEKQYTITATASENGRITPYNIINVNEFSGQSFTIIPNNGYKIKAVYVDGNSIGSSPVYTFSNIIDNHEIYATFRPIFYEIKGSIHYDGKQEGRLYIEAYSVNSPENIVDQKCSIWDLETTVSQFKLQVPNGQYHIRAYIDLNGAVKNKRDEWEAYGKYNAENIIISDKHDQILRNISLSDPVPYHLISTNSNILRGQPGNKCSFHLNYHTTDTTPDLQRLDVRVHYNSEIISFTNITNKHNDKSFIYSNSYEVSNIIDQDENTDRFISLLWENSENIFLDSNHQIRLATINFMVNENLEYGEKSTIQIISDNNTSEDYQFYSLPVTLTIVPFNLDVDCNGEVSALSDGLLILRYLFGLDQGESFTGRSNSLMKTNTFLDGIVDKKNGTCITENEIIENIKRLMPK